MRITRPRAVIALLTAALGIGVFAISANAIIPKGTGSKCSTNAGQPSPSNTFCVNGQFLPNTGLSSTTRKAGSLEVRTSSTYAHPADKAQGGFAHKVVLLFDSDGTINPGAVPHTCSPAQVTGKTPHDAMVACGPLGSNDSWLLPPTSTVFNGVASATGGLKGCSLQFNGPKTSTGNPTVILYARIWTTNFLGCGNPKTTTDPGTTTILKGVISNASAPYGKKLTVDNIDALPLALDDFDGKVKRGSYVSSKCSGHNGLLGGKKYWKMKGTVTYSGGSTNGQPADTAVSNQTCSN
jgi:hypothetical protein